jgi:hypothetical protein
MDATANGWLVKDVDATTSESSTDNYIGPFDTEPEAEAHAEKHRQEFPGHLVSVAPLIDPANC